MDRKGIKIREFSADEKQREFLALAQTMTPRSALHVGDIHRYLTQTPTASEVGDIRDEVMKKLGKKSLDALKYVCLDLNVVPAGTATRELCMQLLVDWVSS